MTEYYVKYDYPKVLHHCIEVGYDISEQEVEDSEMVVRFLTDAVGRVMIFDSEKHAETQILHEWDSYENFRKWAQKIRVVKGEEALIGFCSCDKMKSYEGSNDLIIKIDGKPHIASEGGQKGLERILFCPFCGRRLDE